MVTQQASITAKPYAEFRQGFTWKQGEHVALIGPTGSGKTTLGLDLLEIRDYVTILATKPEDKTLRDFAKRKQYKVIGEFPQWLDDIEGRRLIVWPQMKRFKDKALQRMAIGHAMQTMFVQKNWCIFADEVSYIANDLRLEEHLKLIWQQGRSIGLSLVAGTQRPAHIPLLIYDQSTHLFFWRDNDETNLRRIGGIGFLNAATIREAVARLPKHAFLYINSRTGEMTISRVARD